MLDDNFGFTNDNPNNELTLNLLSSVSGKIDSIEVQNAIASTIQEYIIDKCKVVGTYAGLLQIGTATSPDPKSGDYEFSIGSCIISGTPLLVAAQTSRSLWESSFEVQIKLTLSELEDDSGTISTLIPASMINLNLSFDLDGVTDYKITQNEIAKSIITGIKNCIPVGGGAGISDTESFLSGTLVFTEFI